MKKISIQIPASGQIHDLEIEPGTTCQDVIEALEGLEGYRIRRPGSDDPSDVFGQDENIYPEVEDGQKLLANPKAPVA